MREGLLTTCKLTSFYLWVRYSTMKGSSSAIGGDVNLVAGSNLSTFMQRGGHAGSWTGFGLQDNAQ